MSSGSGIRSTSEVFSTGDTSSPSDSEAYRHHIHSAGVIGDRDNADAGPSVSRPIKAESEAQTQTQTRKRKLTRSRTACLPVSQVTLSFYRI